MLIGLLALTTLSVVSSLGLLRVSRRSNRALTTLDVDHRRLVHSVRHDSLSGLFNRFGIIERLGDRLDAGHDDFSVLYLDIDRFKTINDTLGHGAGDDLLTTIGRRLERVVGAEGDTARIGGDEFVVIVDRSNGDHAHRLAERLARAVIEPVEINGRLLRVSASVGIAIGPWHERSALDVLDHANQALHRAKQHGRDRVEVFTPEMRSDERQRAGDEAELRRAIDRGEIRPFLEPEFDVRTGRLVGAELVPRWIRADGRIVDGESMLSIARDANTVERLTSALVREARPFIRRLRLLGLPDDFRFRVELPRRCTPRAWRDGQILAPFHDVDPTLFTIDVRPEIVAVDPETAIEVISDLRRRGARICLRNADELSTLGNVGIDEIRVEGHLVRGERAVDDAVLHAWADLARRLDLVPSAIGVESSAELARLAAHGCHRLQGPALGPAVTVDDFQRIVENDLVRHHFEPSVP